MSSLLYLFFFLFLSFLLSNSVPNPLFFCQYFKEFYNVIACGGCCSEKLNQNVVSKIGDKYKILKYCIIVVIFLINFGLLALILIISLYRKEENKIVDLEETFIEKKEFDKIDIKDLTEQSSFQDYIKTPMCYTNIHHLNFIQLATLAQAAYFNDNQAINEVKTTYYDKTIFKDSNIDSYNMNFLSTDDSNIVILKSEFKFKNSESNKKLIVFSIRGTSSWKDKWLDLEMFAPSTIFTILKLFPIINKDESLTSGWLNWLLTRPISWMDDSTLLSHYSKAAYSKIDEEIRNNKEDSRFIFVGHSLGGGLSKYIASHYQMQSVSISGPGTTSLEYKNKWPDGYNNYFKTNFIDIIPDNDIVPRLEISGGTKYRILCNKGMFSCHSIDRTVCMMGIMCQQEETTKKLCMSMIKVKDKYNEMRQLKYGENYCNVLEIKNEGEKNKCKSGKVTSLAANEQKCCYVHLKYKIDDEEKDDYKCLEFSKGEKKSYEEALKQKYINPIIEFDNCEFSE